MGITFGDHLIDSGYHDITPEQEREIEAREECKRRGLDPDDLLHYGRPSKRGQNLTQDDKKGGTLDAAQGTAWQCMGRKQAFPEPGECNWPDCGCDPHAMKVIESLIEQGWTAP